MIPTERLREIASTEPSADDRVRRERWVCATELLAARAEAKKYHDALVARHGGEPVALLSELDAARAEVERLTKQRDDLLEAAKLAIREIRPSTDCSMCHDSTWDHECDSKVNTTHVALSNAIKGAIAAEQPKPVCHLCNLPMPDGTDGHGLGECVPVCPTCNGSGTAEPPAGGA